MMGDMRDDFIEALQSRIDERSRVPGIQSVWDEQKHLDTLDDGSPTEARAYWHYGYMVALRDMLGLLDEGLPTADDVRGILKPRS